MRKHSLHIALKIYSLWLALALAAATLLLVACAGTTTLSTQSGSTATVQPGLTQTQTPTTFVNVKIVERNGQYAFDPTKLAIKVGAQVTWTNASDAPHTVTSDSLAFNTPNNLMPNQTFKVIFTKPGTYTYYCNIHTYMTGTITVTS